MFNLKHKEWVTTQYSCKFVQKEIGSVFECFKVKYFDQLVYFEGVSKQALRQLRDLTI